MLTVVAVMILGALTIFDSLGQSFDKVDILLGYEMVERRIYFEGLSCLVVVDVSGCYSLTLTEAGDTTIIAEPRTLKGAIKSLMSDG